MGQACVITSAAVSRKITDTQDTLDKIFEVLRTCEFDICCIYGRPIAENEPMPLIISAGRQYAIRWPDNGDIPFVIIYRVGLAMGEMRVAYFNEDDLSGAYLQCHVCVNEVHFTYAAVQLSNDFHRSEIELRKIKTIIGDRPFILSGDVLARNGEVVRVFDNIIAMPSSQIYYDDNADGALVYGDVVVSITRIPY